MINTLLLTGENNHDWRRSAPFCKNLLQATGLFKVDLVEDSTSALADADSLESYQLFFLDYNGAPWGEPAQANFVQAVHNGAGVVALHAADNAFTGWTEYEKMIGLLWREGTGHGEFHAFDVHIEDRDHPITRTLEDFNTWDELYHRLVHLHSVPYHVLATAYSDPAKGGTGNHEPVMVITQYGAGRVYHHVLGHVWDGDPKGAYRGASMIAFENEMFQHALIRGAQWAATGDVTWDGHWKGHKNV